MRTFQTESKGKKNEVPKFKQCLSDSQLLLFYLLKCRCHLFTIVEVVAHAMYLLVWLVPLARH